MKITKSELQRLIKEELDAVLGESMLPTPGGSAYARLLACLEAVGNTKCVQALVDQDVAAFARCIMSSPGCAPSLRPQF